MSVKQYAEALIELKDLGKNDFPKTPAGYARRERAALVQLCLHESKAVRKAAAQIPCMRDMFIVAMYENETDQSIRKLLEPQYQAALSKSDKRDSELEGANREIERLKAQLKAKLK